MTVRNLMPPSLDEVLKSLNLLDDKKFEIVKELTLSKASFYPSEKKIQSASKDVDVDAETIKFMLSVLAYLYSLTSKMTNAEVTGSINKFCNDAGIEDDSGAKNLTDRIVSVVRGHNIHAEYLERQRLEIGFLPNIQSIHSFVDVRYGFDRNQDGDIDGLTERKVFSIQLKIETDSKRAYERFAVFQLDDETLELFESALVEIKVKKSLLEKEID